MDHEGYKNEISHVPYPSGTYNLVLNSELFTHIYKTWVESIGTQSFKNGKKQSGKNMEVSF